MFLYLSKLLPLFVYPVGLTIVLVAAALFLRRFQRVSVVLLLLSVTVLLVFGNGDVAGRLAMTLEWQYLPQESVAKADAIVLLGGATRASVYPRQTTEMNEAGDRIVEAVRLYRAGAAPIILVTGGAIDWLGSSTPEADGMRELLEFMGVPGDVIYADAGARNTYENAVNVRAMADELNVYNILLVTSAMHMPRSVAIFEKQGFTVHAAPTDFLTTESDSGGASAGLGARFYRLFPEAQYVDQSTRAMKEYLGAMVYRLRGWM